MTIRVMAHAKLNLFLAVAGVRADGLHEIESLVQTISLSDRITITPASDVLVSCSVQMDGPNIAELAVRELLREKRTRSGVRIWIEKHIPIGAGLGGGSSDAAAVLATVNQLIPPLITSTRLDAIAGSLGADVPLFLKGGCVGLAGVGHPEGVYPTRKETLVLLVPDVRCSTKDVYTAWQSDDSDGHGNEFGNNDLAPAAMRIHPELHEIGSMIDELGGIYAGMTGSGSAFFAAFRNDSEASLAYESLARQGLDSRVYYCRPTASGFSEVGRTEHTGL